MASTVLVDVVRGPEDLAGFGKSLVLDPVQPTTRPDRYPSQAVIITNAARRLIELSKAGERLESIVVQGELDPTMHPEFVEISENLRELCRKWFPKSQLALHSVAPRLQDPLVRHALLAYHAVVIRFEWATQKTFKSLTGGDGAEFKSLVENLAGIDHRNLIIKASFVRGTVDNSTDQEIRGWGKILSAAKPATVQIETPARQKDGVKPISRTRLTQISEFVAEKVGAQVELI
jgi:wyosine [tRNA(Phe)-imidazoG37] synthetase (radical SAM superfamily)